MLRKQEIRAARKKQNSSVTEKHMRTTLEIIKSAREAAPVLAASGTEQRNRALLAMADRLEEACADILKANAKDVEASRSKYGAVMIDRLMLSEARIKGMADGIRDVAELPDPAGKVLAEAVRPNGLVIKKTAVPLGVITIIYESRPNVTSDAASLAIKSANAAVLRGGKESFRSNYAITQALKKGLEDAGLPADLVGLVEDTSRASAMEIMQAEGLISHFFSHLMGLF